MPADQAPKPGDLGPGKRLDNLLDQLHAQTRRMRDAWHAGEAARLRILATQLTSMADGEGNAAMSESAMELESVLLAEEAETAHMCEKIEALILQCKKAATSTE